MFLALRYFMLGVSSLLTLHLCTQEEIVKVGQQVSYFTIATQDGKIIDSAALKNKVVLINFFATWCRPCMKELSILQTRVWEKYRDNTNFVLLVVGSNIRKKK